MLTLSNVSVAQLKQAILIKEKIEQLETQLSAMLGSTATASRSGSKMSPAARAKISVAAKARWAKLKGSRTTVSAPKKKSQISAATKAKLSALAKARWAKIRAQGKKSF